MFAQVVGDLRSARRDAGLSQNALSAGMPVRGRAISEWETGAMEPTLGHLIQWSRELDRRLVIIGPDGMLRHGPMHPRANETRQSFEQRRLTAPLRNRRVALGLAQGELGRLLGVSRDSVSRWELLRVPPRPIALIVWAQKLDCFVAIRPIGTPEGHASKTGHGQLRAARYPRSDVKAARAA
ncbi:helix-turn-helix domain-containing protein [Catenulispora sp. GAS73]|uniref:helix-turn-helix domain-containing protein n=1 Tax=Catenulispora sp. GAS73 TaxID=3156269 RepID=UPI003511CA33